MKTLTGLLIASLLFCAGCNSMFDRQNVTGADFAKSRTPLFPSDSMTVTGLDTSRTYTSLFPLSWTSDGICRMGRSHGYVLTSYLEFGVTGVPADFYSFYDGNLDNPFDGFHGLDSIRLQLRFESSSRYAYDTLHYRLAFIAGNKLQNLRIDTLSDNTLDTLSTFSLDTANFVTLDTLFLDIAPGDSFRASILLSDTTRPIFHFLDSTLLSPNRVLAGDTTRVAFCLQLLPEPGHDALLTLSPAVPPVLVYFGRVIPVYYNSDSTFSYSDSARTDSVSAQVRLLSYACVLPQTDRLYGDLPTAATYYFQADTAVLPRAHVTAGTPQAVFTISRDSLLKGLTPDSLSILRARAVFPVITDPDTSFTEDGQGVDLSVQCNLVNSRGQVLILSNAIFNQRDTVFRSFSPVINASLVYPIDKFVAALTDPRYTDITALSFIIRPYHLTRTSTSLNRAARIVFKKEMKVDFAYTQR